MKIEIRNETFYLHHSKILVWPSQKILIAADFHLGKAETFQQQGLWLPSIAQQHDLQILQQVAIKYDLDQIVFLGDFVHSTRGVTELVIQQFVDWKKCFLGRVTVIIGNHDRALEKKWPKAWDFIELKDQVQIGEFVLQHEPPSTADLKTGDFFWCGHIHPTLKLRYGPDQLRFPVFVVSKNYGYLPAFSSLAGGMNVAIEEGKRYFVVAENNVYEIGGNH